MRYFGLVACLFAVLFSVGAQTATGAPGDGKFRLFGWARPKLSADEMARSAERAQRLRALPMDSAAASPTLVAAVSPSVSGSSLAAGAPLIAPPPIPDPGSRSQTATVHRAAEPSASVVASTPPPQQRKAPASVGRGLSKKETPVDELRRRAEIVAKEGLDYKFGGDSPSEGGMDCSAAMRYLFRQMGYTDMPRTSYQQYDWVKERGKLKKIGFFHSQKRAVRKLRPGDLLFTGGTYDSGHKVSHVMMYMGKGRSGKHYVFGARGSKCKGLNGSGVDVFEFYPRYTKLVGYGRLPGISR